MSVKEHDVWTDPILVQDKINSQGHDACLYLSPDGQLMYVYRQSADGNEQAGIYQVKKDGDGWGELELLESSINSKFWETDASLDTYGNIIFFTNFLPWIICRSNYDYFTRSIIGLITQSFDYNI